MVHVGHRVVVPVLPVLPVPGVDLPRLARLLLALDEALLLLLSADVEEELEDDRVVLHEQLLEVADVPVALLPDGLGDEPMHAHDEHVLVVGAVEDGELALARCVAVDAPEEVVLPLLLAGHAEGGDADASGVEEARHVLDDPVLPRGVPALEHDEHGVQARAPQEVLEVEQLVAERLQLLPGLVAVHALGRRLGDVAQPHLLIRLVEADDVHAPLPRKNAEVPMGART